MSNLSELLPSGGGQNVVEFTADGAISAGDAVALQTDGTVTGISSAANPASVGSNQDFTGNNAYYNAVTSAGDNKVVVFYVDGNNSSYHYCAVGTVSGDTITWSTPVVVESATANTNVDVTYSPTDGVVIFAYATSSAGRVRKASLSGTTLTFGTAANFTSSRSADDIRIAMATSENYATIIYRRSASGGYGYYRTQECGNGTTISQYFETAFKSANVTALGIAKSSALGDIAIVYKLVSDASGKVIAAALPALYSTAYSFSSEVQFFSVIQDCDISKTFNETLDRNIIYSNQSSAHKAYVLSTNGSSTPTVNGPYTVGSSANSFAMSVSINTDDSSVLFGYSDSSNSNYATFQFATMTTTAISLSGSTLATSYALVNTTGGADLVANEGGSANFVFVAKDNTATDGVANVVTPASSNVSDFIGLASAAISDTASGDINVKGGINEAQSGLTIGSDYYVQSDGTISTTSTSPAVKIGQAITATTINMMDLT